jgi:hypothetical protein
MTPPGSAGTASDGFRTPKPEGRHRAPPTVPTPRTVTGLAVAAAVLAAASLSALAATAVAPDATATGVRGAAVTTTPRTTAAAGPLAMPSVGVVAPVVQEMHGTPEPVSRPVPTKSVRTHTGTFATPEALRNDPVAIAGPSEQTVTPTTPAVTPTPSESTTETAPPSTPATETSATTEETPVPTETVTPTVEPTPTPEPVDVAVTSEAVAP